MTSAPVVAITNRSTMKLDRSIERRHILALDGLRGVAILLVVACHFVSNLHLAPHGSDWLIITIAHAGWTGVDLFFVLSGFLITGILVNVRGSDSYFTSFYGRRALRIIPVYYGFLFAIFVVLPLLQLGAGANYMLARQHQAWYWLHQTNIMMALGQTPGHGPYPSTLFWSLAVEEQFYLVWPVIVAWSPATKLKRICVAGIAMCVVLRIGGGLFGVSGLTLSVLPITRGDTLFAGGLLAIEYANGNLARYTRMAKAASLASLCLLVGLVAYYGQLDYLDRGTAMFGSIAIMVLCGSALVLAVTAREPLITRALRSSFLRFFGRYSYAMYVVHTAVLAALDHYRPFASLGSAGGSVLPLQAAWAFSYVGLSTLIAIASWNIVEKHFLRLKSYFPYGQSATPHYLVS